MTSRDLSAVCLQKMTSRDPSAALFPYLALFLKSGLFYNLRFEITLLKSTAEYQGTTLTRRETPFLSPWVLFMSSTDCKIIKIQSNQF